MPKYVCEFATVKEAGTSLKNEAGEMTSATGTFESGISSDLSTWTGEAKTAFDSSLSNVVSTTKETAAFAEKLGTHIEEAATKIEDLDNEIAGSINISY